MEYQVFIYKLPHTLFVQMLQQLARIYVYIHTGGQQKKGFKWIAGK